VLWGEQYGAASGEILRLVKGRRTAPLCQQHAQPALCTRRPSDIVEMVVPRTPLPKPDAGGRDGLRRKAHLEPLPSLDDRSDPQAFHHNPAQRPGLALHYQCRDYASLQRRPPCPSPLVAPGLPRDRSRGSRSHSVPAHRPDRLQRRTAISAVAAGGYLLRPPPKE
jgi:hypothetical protein